MNYNKLYVVSNVDEALRDAFASFAGSINQFMKNRYDIYDIIIETVDKIKAIVSNFGTVNLCFIPSGF